MVADDAATDERSNEPPVETHATLREGKDRGRMRQVVACAVENYIEEAGPQDHAERRTDHYGEQIVVGDIELPAFVEGANHQVGADKACEVGDPVPANREWSDLDCDRIEMLVDVIEPHEVPFLCIKKSEALSPRLK